MIKAQRDAAIAERDARFTQDQIDAAYDAGTNSVDQDAIFAAGYSTGVDSQQSVIRQYENVANTAQADLMTANAEIDALNEIKSGLETQV